MLTDLKDIANQIQMMYNVISDKMIINEDDSAMVIQLGIVIYDLAEAYFSVVEAIDKLTEIGVE